jgi:transcriptional regulator with XRE-family HTH domain
MLWMEDQELRGILSVNIKLYRSRREWSQVKLAEKLDISTNFLADIETGKSWVSSITLVKLANVLNIEVYELFKPVSTSNETPNEKTANESKEIMTRLVRDMSIALNKSVNQAMNQSLENVTKHYMT